MTNVKEAEKRDYKELESAAVDALNKAAENLVQWIELVRDPEKPWAFKWAPESTRRANVGATQYILAAARRCGVLDQVLSFQQKQKGAEWIKSLEIEDNTYADPALLDRKPPQWNDAKESWPPDGAHQEAMNQYARDCLIIYTGELFDPISGPPPPSWPQKGDSNVLNWLKEVEPNWSWIGRMLHRMILWYSEGEIERDTLLECLNYAHSRQDPETGFWGGGIQRTFKLLILVHDPMEMRIPRAEKIIDSVLQTMDDPDYDKNLFPCEEYDAFYDLAMAITTAPDYRRETIKKLAAYRTASIINSHTQADNGISSYADHCLPTWLMWDMAPELPQGDVFGWGIYSSGINICVDLLGLQDRVSWTGNWRQRDMYDTTGYIKVKEDIKKDLELPM